MYQFLPGLLREFQVRRNFPDLFSDPFIMLQWMAVPVYLTEPREP